MHMNKSHNAGRAAGFTLVELLIVLAIIALLIGLLLTGLRAARSSAREAQQLSNMRQLYIAWSAYAMQNDDACIPGFLDTGVQTSWRVKYRNASGQVVDPQLTQTYPWRLAGFLNFDTEVTIGYLDRLGETFESSVFQGGSIPFSLPASLTGAAGLPGSAAALQPEFGYNGFYLGGWWETVNSAPQMRFANTTHPTTGVTVLPVARTISNITRPENMITFCAATYSDAGLIKDVDEITPGAAWVSPPFLGQTQVWTFGPGGDSNSISVLSPQAVPLRRYNAIIYSAADGGQRKASYKELWDMALWTNRADLPDAERLQPVHTGN